MSTAPQLLGRAEAVELMHAWVADTCRRAGRRHLLIKGPSLAHHELRDPRTSSDVDVLVHPDDFAALTDSLERAGWRLRPGTFASERFSVHSASFVADGWPCDIDVHRHFPGFLADPAVVFDELWRRRTTMTLAHVACDIPDRLGAVLISALHSLRGNTADRRHRRELATLIDRVELQPNERDELLGLAIATGCDQTLAEVVSRWGVQVPRRADDDPALTEWRFRVGAGASPTYMWVSMLRRRTGDRAAILRHALWPRTADLHLMNPGLPRTRRHRACARLRRLFRGLRALPRVARAAARSRRTT